MDEADKRFSLRLDFPLHYLAKVGDYEELSNFLELDPVHGVKQISRRDFQGRTCLHYAAMGVNLTGGEKCVEIILKFLNDLKTEGKNMFLSTGINRLTNRIRRKQHWRSRDSQETINFINLKDIEGETALHIAAKNENANIIQALLMHSADVLPVSNTGEQVLTLIYKKTPSAVTALLDNSVYFDYGVDADSFNNTHRSYCLDFTAVIGDTSDCVKEQEDISCPDNKSSTTNSLQPIIYEEAYCLYKIDVDDTNTEIYKEILTHPLVRFFVEKKIKKLKWIIFVAIFLKLVWIGLYMWHIVEIYYSCCELNFLAEKLSTPQLLTCSQFPFKLENMEPEQAENFTEEDRKLAFDTVLNCTHENDKLWRSIPVSLLTVYVLLTIIFKCVILSREYILKLQNAFTWIFTLFIMITLYPSDHSFWIQYQFAAFGILLGALVVLELVHKHIYWAIYIRVIITVIRRFLATLPLFFFIVVAFSISMRMMFPNINPPVHDFRNAVMEVFSAIANGKVEWTEGRRYQAGVDANYPVSGFLMFMVFYVTMILLLFRVLIGFVVADTKKIQEREELNEISQDLKEIFLFESITNSKGYHWLSSFQMLRFLHQMRETFMLCPKNRMQLWLKESEIPRHLRKPMRAMASKNSAKFRNKKEVNHDYDATCKDTEVQNGYNESFTDRIETRF